MDMCMSRLGVMIVLLIAAPLFALADASKATSEDTVYYNGNLSYSFAFPRNWKQQGYEHKSSKAGGTYRIDYILRDSDFYSRVARAFTAKAGPVAAVFDLNPAITARLSDSDLVNFYIDQLSYGLIDYAVKSVAMEDLHGTAVYRIDAQYTVPGPYTVTQTDRIAFKGGNVYIWSTSYFNSFSADAPALVHMADTFDIR